MSQKIRILRIINRFNLGGPTYNVAFLTKYLGCDYETLLIGGTNEASEASSTHILNQLNISPSFIKNMQREVGLLADIKAWLEIVSIIKTFKPHIIHTHASKAGALGRLAAIWCGVPITVHTFHGHVFKGYFGTFKTNAFKWVERFLARHTDAIVTLSEIQKQELAVEHKIAAAAKFHIIPLGFNLKRFAEQTTEKRQAFRSANGLLETDLAIGIVGRLVPIKNHKMYFNAIAFLKKQGIAVKGIVIGDGEMAEELKQYAQSLDLIVSQSNANGADVLFMSWQTEVYRLLPGLDIVTLSSKNEGTPVSLIEAQAAGVPIVSTNVGGVANIINQNGGLLCDSDDQETYNQHLLKLCTDHALRLRMSNSGQADVLKRFSYERLCADMDGLYQKLLNRKGIKLKISA